MSVLTIVLLATFAVLGFGFLSWLDGINDEMGDVAYSLSKFKHKEDD